MIKDDLMKTYLRSCSPIAVILITLLLVSSCGYFQRVNERTPAVEVPTHLLERGNLYCSLSRPAYEEKGYVHGKCDGSGFTSLYSIRCPNVDLTVFDAADGSGKLFRSPSQDCLIRGESKSESSRDMLLMRMVAAYASRDYAWIATYKDFVDRENGIICESDGSLDGLSRCIITPFLNDLLHKMPTSASLAGKTGFQAHLDVLGIWLYGSLYGAITDSQLRRLKEYTENAPDNALNQAVYHRFTDGDQSRALELLEEFPQDRLPNSSDWCTEYKWQRDQGTADWEPCSESEETHSGTDYNLVLYMIGA